MKYFKIIFFLNFEYFKMFIMKVSFIYFKIEKKLDFELLQNQHFKYFTIEKNVDFEVNYFKNLHLKNS